LLDLHRPLFSLLKKSKTRVTRAHNALEIDN
jgi:hypothetical protein